MKESLDTSFSVMLSKSDIFIILDCLRAGSMEPVTGLIASSLLISAFVSISNKIISLSNGAQLIVSNLSLLFFNLLIIFKE